MTRIINRDALIISIFVSFTVTFFAPLEIFLTNTADFWFSLTQLLSVIGVAFLCIFIIIYILVRVTIKKWRIVTGFLFSIGLALYIQGNFLFNNYGELNGQAIAWADYRAWGVVNTLLWVIFLIVPTILVMRLRKGIGIVKLVSAILVGVQIFTIIALLFLAPQETGRGSYYLSTKGQFELSKDKNVVVFVLDCYDANFITHILEKDPDISEKLTGFVFYNNCVSVYPTTIGGLPLLLTGKINLNENTFTDYVDIAFEEASLYKQMDDQGYIIGIYTPGRYVSSKAPIDNIEWNKLEITSYPLFLEKIYQCVMLRYAPHYMKKYFWMYTGEFNSLSKAALNAYAPYEIDDLKFYNDLSEDGLVLTRSNTFHFYHLMGAHPPYTYSNKLTPVADGEGDMLDQAEGAFKIVLKFLDALKDNSLYDKTMVMITADHGQKTHYSPLLIKGWDKTESFRVSHAAASATEIYATLLEEVTGTDNGLPTVYDWPEEANRVRMTLGYQFTEDDWRATYLPAVTKAYYWFGDTAHLYQTGLQYSGINNPSNDYKMGEEILFNSDDFFRFVNYGFTPAEGDAAWLVGNAAEMSFRLEAASKKDINLLIRYKYVINDKQKVVLHVNNNFVTEQTVDTNVYNLSFSIPKSYVSNENIVIRLEIPEAVDPKTINPESTDDRLLSLMVESITINED
jgi:hypothetical protein